jgi:hypothetical protein
LLLLVFLFGGDQHHYGHLRLHSRAKIPQTTTLHADKVTGYTITVKSTSEAVNINVTVKDGNYVITINGTTITVGTVVAVLVTTA